MKKLYQSKKAKKYNKKCQKRSLINRKRRKIFLKIKDTEDYKEKQKNKKIKKIKEKKQLHSKKITFEKDFNFSFIENTENLLKYFNDAKNHFSEGKDVKFNLSQINKVTPDAIALYIALCTDKKITKGNYFSGNLPNDKELKLIFLKCGFFNFFNSKIPKGLETQQIYNVKSNQRCDVKIAGEICDKIIGDKKEKLEKNFLYEILIELMLNTYNHASGSSEEEKYHWCFQSYYDEETKIYKCSFIDVGIGILKSLPVNKYKEGIIFKEKNQELFKKVLKGKIKKKGKSFTRIEQNYRGKGIPLVYNNIINEERFLRLVIITNDVFADIKKEQKEEFKKLKNHFEGTFYYWEIKGDENE